eukprot:348531_1
MAKYYLSTSVSFYGAKPRNLEPSASTTATYKAPHTPCFIMKEEMMMTRVREIESFLSECSGNKMNARFTSRTKSRSRFVGRRRHRSRFSSGEIKECTIND